MYYRWECVGSWQDISKWKILPASDHSQTTLEEKTWQAWEERALGQGMQRETLGMDAFLPDSGIWGESLVPCTLIKYLQALCWLLLREQGHCVACRKLMKPVYGFLLCTLWDLTRWLQRGKTMLDFPDVPWEIPYELKAPAEAAMPGRQVYVSMAFMRLWNYSKMKSLLKFS